MNLLYLSPYLTMPKIGAGVGSASHLAAIKECLPVDSLTIVALNYTGEKAKGLDENVIVIDSFRNQFEKNLNILTLNGICMNQRVRKAVLKIIKENKIECVFLDESILGKLTYQIKKAFPSVKIISFYHDVKANLCRQWIKQGGLKTVPYNWGLILNEKINTKYADTHIVLNRRETALFQKYYHKSPEFLLPHFVVDTNNINIKEINTVETESKVIELIFVGVDYQPNVEGIQWFIDSVMPYVKNNFHLYIVGKGMERYKDRFSKKNVTVIGTVDNLAEWYMRADVVVSPIFVGGGMKTKTAEAFQYGKLLVATTESYEGYAENIPQSMWNRLCWLADDSETYIKILNMLAETRIRKYNNELCELYKANYSLQAGVERMRKILSLN